MFHGIFSYIFSDVFNCIFNWCQYWRLEVKAISLKLSERELQLSNESAEYLGINRSQFIRLAIEREYRRVKRARMAVAMAEMSRDPKFIAEFNHWEEGTISDGIADEETEGWFTLPEVKSAAKEAV
jgi:hypothetical protein